MLLQTLSIFLGMEDTREGLKVSPSPGKMLP